MDSVPGNKVSFYPKTVLIGGLAIALFSLVAAGCGTAATQTVETTVQKGSKFALDSSVSSEPTSDPESANGPEIEPVNLDGRQLFADVDLAFHFPHG